MRPHLAVAVGAALQTCSVAPIILDIRRTSASVPSLKEKSPQAGKITSSTIQQLAFQHAL
jgi:hypothetical protein